MTATAGVCVYNEYKLQYQIVSLEYVANKSLKIEAICYNKRSFDKEAVFKYSTNNFRLFDERLEVSLTIVDSLIENLKLDKSKLKKLTVIGGEIYYILA